MKNLRESGILKRLMSKRFLGAMLNSNGYLAGGAVRAVFTSEPVKDFDIFFRSREDFDRCLEAIGSTPDDSVTFTQTDTAWTHNDGKMLYQLICAEFGEPAEVIKKFDFTCCMAAWTGKEFILDDLFLKHCAQRRLVFNPNAGYPICSAWRAIKFVKRGWNFPGVEVIKLALKMHHIKIDTHADLKTQLLGIDTLFLKELTDALATDGQAVYDFGEALDLLNKFLEEEHDI